MTADDAAVKTIRRGTHAQLDHIEKAVMRAVAEIAANAR